MLSLSCEQPVNNLFTIRILPFIKPIQSLFVLSFYALFATTFTQIVSFFTHAVLLFLTVVVPIFSTIYTETIATTTFYLKIINNPVRGIK